MNYQQELKKFLTSQYLYTGLRITTGVIIPAILLYRFGLLAEMISIPLGALFISLTDNPGPLEQRRNGMMIAIVISFIVIIISGYSRFFPWLIFLEIILFGMLFSITGIFGNRANSIGLVLLIVFILNIDRTKSSGNIPLQAALFSFGGAWYSFLSLILYSIRPYRPIEQLLGECLMETANYLKIKSSFYENASMADPDNLQLIQSQVRIHQYHEQLRQLLYTTRKYFSESTNKGRILMMMFLNSIDLMERIMTSQQDYNLLHKEFGQTGILDQIRKNIIILADTLHDIGLTIQSGTSYKPAIDTENILQETTDKFNELRKTQLSSLNVEGFIRLRHIFYNIADLTERINWLGKYSTFKYPVSENRKVEPALEKFVQKDEISLHLLLSNFSLKSSTFRHSLRVTIGLLIGYLISMFLPVGHGYWILLTIAVILKPAYSITRKRNIQRLIGTFVGTGIGFGLLFLTRNNQIIFSSMIVAMIIAYSFLKLNYAVAAAGLTLFILLNFHFLNPSGFHSVLIDRIIDTLAGSAIAFVISYTILPSWEHTQLNALALESLKTNKDYFDSIAYAFTGKIIDIPSYKLARKKAFVALANFSDAFQRMLSEPQNRQSNPEYYHLFAATSHMLTSYIASLAYYADFFGSKYADDSFARMIRLVDKKFEEVIAILKGNTVLIKEEEFPLNKKVLQLLDRRKADLKTVTDQFQLIYATIEKLVNLVQPPKG